MLLLASLYVIPDSIIRIWKYKYAWTVLVSLDKNRLEVFSSVLV
jgi:hypothetical protein